MQSLANCPKILLSSRLYKDIFFLVSGTCILYVSQFDWFLASLFVNLYGKISNPHNKTEEKELQLDLRNYSEN